jgi:exo-rhamnogalacturonan lyase-like protein
MSRSGVLRVALVALAVLCCSAVSQALEVPLTVTESTGVDRALEPVTTGVPFAKGVLKNVSGLSVVDANGKRLPCQFRQTSSWSDGSVRWALMDTQVTVAANESTTVKVGTGARARPASPVVVTDKAGALSVSTGRLAFTVSKTKFNIFQSLSVDGKDLISGKSPGLVLYPGAGNVVANGAPKVIKVEEAGPMRTVVLVRGVYPKVHKGLLHYTVRITAYAGKPYVKLRVWLENDGKYGYVGTGEWYRFDGQAVEFDLGLGDIKNVSLDGERVAGGGLNFRVAQHNPKLNWQGFKYTATADGKTVKTGARTGGVVSLDGAKGKLTVGVRYFWENYSKAIEVDDGRLKIWLWPTDGQWPVVTGRWRNRGGGDFRQFVKPGVYHIPGCVRKGHELILDFSGRNAKAAAATLRSPLMALAKPEYYASTQAAPGWFAPAAFKTGDAKYDKAAANWDKQALNGVDHGARSSVWKAREGGAGRVRMSWYGWMNFGDNAWGGGFSSLHYDWSWTMLLNYMRQGNREFLDMGVTMVRHLIEVDHLWSTRNHKMLQQMARFEFNSPYTHGGLSDGRCKPTPSHVWISGVVLYYMLTGDPIAKECAISTGKGLRLRMVNRFKKAPSAGGQGRSSGWGMLVYCSLFDLTGDKKYLDDGLILFRNNQKMKWKAKGPYADGGLQYYYSTQGLCELQDRTGDAEIMQMLEEGCKGNFSDKYAEWRVFLSNIYAYVGHKKNNPAYIKKAKDLFLGYKSPGIPKCFTSSGAWDKETGKYIRNGHILQHVLWKQAQKK